MQSRALSTLAARAGFRSAPQARASARSEGETKTSAADEPMNATGLSAFTGG
jgi:hypothetical protein